MQKNEEKKIDIWTSGEWTVIGSDIRGFFLNKENNDCNWIESIKFCIFKQIESKPCHFSLLIENLKEIKWLGLNKMGWIFKKHKLNV